MSRRRQILGVLGAAVLIAAPCASVSAQTPPQTPATCARSDFEAVVASAADALRTITQQNSPSFQAKLRALKDKRSWSHEQFLADGARFVRDDKILSFDEKSGDLLARINDAGGNASETQGNCGQLAELKANMAALVELQTAKWAYMFANIDAELAR
jgi:hypothetical protein